MKNIRSAAKKCKLFLQANAINSQATSRQIVGTAMQVMEKRYCARGYAHSPELECHYAQMKMRHREREVFAMFLLDNKHRIIEFIELFQGSINVCKVYPREVVKAALAKNAGAVIFTHNHPSGVAEPSEADRTLTAHQSVLELLELDHLVVGASSSRSG